MQYIYHDAAQRAWRVDPFALGVPTGTPWGDMYPDYEPGLYAGKCLSSGKGDPAVSKKFRYCSDFYPAFFKNFGQGLVGGLTYSYHWPGSWYILAVFQGSWTLSMHSTVTTSTAVSVYPGVPEGVPFIKRQLLLSLNHNPPVTFDHFIPISYHGVFFSGL